MGPNPCRAWIRGGVLAAASALPVGAQELEVHFLDVGKGDAILVRSPAGKTLLIDSGKDGRGSETLLPFLLEQGIDSLDYAVASHYDSDHIGGFDGLVRAGLLPGVVYDRGEYNHYPPSDSYQEYRDAVASVRATLTPGLVIDLGGGVSATCYCVNGDLMGGGSVPIASHPAFENAASIGLLIEFGDFSLWTAGDQLGAVAEGVASLVGDVDVLKVNHHGATGSVSPAQLAALAPEVAVLQVGGNTSFPAPSTLAGLSPAGAMRWVYQNQSTSNGADGALLAHGHVRLVTDGKGYRVDGGELEPRRFACDEHPQPAPERGDVVLGEFLAEPSTGPLYGEYFEITNLRSRAFSLAGLSFADLGTDGFTIHSPALLEPRESLVLAVNGDPRKNGGFRAAGVWPPGSFNLEDGADEILMGGLEAIHYAGLQSPGVAIERRDLYRPPSFDNFTEAKRFFGEGDRGTPGAENFADQTPWLPLLTAIEPDHGPFAGGTFVTLRGYDLDRLAEPVVSFGRRAALDLAVLDGRSARALSPPVALPLDGRLARMGLHVDVRFENANGLASLDQAFLYDLPGAPIAPFVPSSLPGSSAHAGLTPP